MLYLYHLFLMIAKMLITFSLVVLLNKLRVDIHTIQIQCINCLLIFADAWKYSQFSKENQLNYSEACSLGCAATNLQKNLNSYFSLLSFLLLIISCRCHKLSKMVQWFCENKLRTMHVNQAQPRRL